MCGCEKGLDMKYSSILAATVAAGALVGVAMPAQARTVKHHAAKAASSESEEIRELRAEVQALKSRLDAQEAAQTQTAATVQQAQTENSAAITAVKTSAEQAQASAAAAQEAAQKSSKDEGDLSKVLAWAKDTQVSGRMYFNASHITHKANGVKDGNADNGGGFAIKRFYLGVDHKFNDTFSANLTTDVSAISGVGMSLYIKKAYLQAKVSPALVIRAGSADMPWIPYAEGVYGYRHIEQTVSDRTKFGTSADWGVHVMGDLAGGLISYQVSAVDGGGYRNPQFTKTVDLEGRISAKYKGFEAAVGGYTGELGVDVQQPVGTPAPSLRNYNRFNALLAYKGKIDKMPFTVGGEYFYAEGKVFNSTKPQLDSAPKDKSDGYSAFASLGFMPKWSVFGRYDSVKPAEVSDYGLKDDYYNLGLQWSPAKIVDLALVYKHEQARNGAFQTGSLQSGFIGCALAASETCVGKGTYDEIGIFGQFRF